MIPKFWCQVWTTSAGTQRLKPGKSHGEDGSRQAAGPERICFTSLNISTFGAHNQKKVISKLSDEFGF